MNQFVCICVCERECEIEKVCVECKMHSEQSRVDNVGLNKKVVETAWLSFTTSSHTCEWNARLLTKNNTQPVPSESRSIPSKFNKFHAQYTLLLNRTFTCFAINAFCLLMEQGQRVDCGNVSHVHINKNAHQNSSTHTPTHRTKLRAYVCIQKWLNFRGLQKKIRWF